jgi:hypothetical protein
VIHKLIKKLIGDINTSPLTEKSSNLIYQFYENRSDKQQQNILLIGLPQKGKFSFLMAVDILTRLLKDDLAKTKVSSHLRSLNKGDKIIFFESKRAEFNSFNKTSITFKSKYYGNEPFKKTETQRLSILYGSAIKKYTGGAKTLHTIKDILSKAVERRESTTARDKLLLTVQSTKKLGVPSGLLKSKVMLVTGNGSKKKFTNWAEEIEIYEEKVASLFNENLRIEKDLNKFKDFFSSDAKHERIKYNNFAITELFDCADRFPDLADDILELIYEFERGDYNEDNIIELREDIKILYGETKDLFEILIKKMPKFSSPLPSGLKLVIIDSLDIVENYQNVIIGLASLKIKVVCVYDLNNISENNPFPDSPRYFWNREKIKGIVQHENSDNLIDRKLFNKSLRYSQQNFTASIYNDDDFTEFYWKIYNKIKDVDGEENMVNLFWQSLHPLYYLLKNSPNIDNHIKFKLLDSFDTDLKNILTGNSKTEDLFEEFTIRAKAFSNLKVLEYGNVYSQSIMIDSEEINIPQYENTENLRFVKNVNSTFKNIIFSGIPYKEYQLKLIDGLIRNCSIPDIKFLCFEKEYAYLSKIINNIERSDWLRDNDILKLAQQSGCSDAKNELEIVKIDQSSQLSKSEIIDNQEYERLSQRQTAFYHSRYKGKSGTYTKKSVTIYIKSNKWIYIPNNDNIYFIDSVNGIIGQKKGSKLNKSDIIVLFNISKRDLRAVESSNEDMDNVFDDLEIWSNALTKLFKSCNYDYNRLEEKLLLYKNDKRKKANPNRINLMRWLDDNDLTLAPREYNLEIILDATGLLNEKQKIIVASKKISLHERKFKKNIKKEISNKSSNFIVTGDEIITKELFVNGVSVVITACKVMSIDNEVLDIDNAYVKKII